jgi:hypothetical protein
MHFILPKPPIGARSEPAVASLVFFAFETCIEKVCASCGYARIASCHAFEKACGYLMTAHMSYRMQGRRACMLTALLMFTTDMQKRGTLQVWGAEQGFTTSRQASQIPGSNRQGNPWSPLPMC